MGAYINSTSRGSVMLAIGNSAHFKLYNVATSLAASDWMYKCSETKTQNTAILQPFRPIFLVAHVPVQ